MFPGFINRMQCTQLLPVLKVVLLSLALNGSPVAADLWRDSLSRYAHSDFDSYADAFLGDRKRSIDYTIAREKKQFARSKRHLYRVTQRSRWYASYIIDRCLQRGLPVELALLPMVESAFDPFAFSQGGAAGLWQFMPATGRQFGLESNWWFDQRRDVIDSTEAALSYLEYLYGRFDDWLLAVAAYNAGPTRVRRAINKNVETGGAGGFWELQLPTETARYVPRILAIRDMLLGRALADVEIYSVPDSMAFQAVEVDGQMDLAEAAEFAGVSVQTLYLLNAGLNRWATSPEGPHRLLLPSDAVARFKQRVASADFSNRLMWQRHQVRSGDTLGEIALQYATRVEFIQLANSLNSHEIQKGQKLMIPFVGRAVGYSIEATREKILRMKEVQQGVRATRYEVQPGDSWWLIAKRKGVGIDELLEWNQATADTVLRNGRELVIWEPVDRNRRDVLRTIYYKVKRGDSLSRIASRFDVSVAHIVARNGLQVEDMLRPGQNLSINVKIAGH